jgi:hypothetical protein
MLNRRSEITRTESSKGRSDRRDDRTGQGYAAVVTVDWAMRENVRAQLGVIIKRILHKYGYPPDNRRRQRKLFGTGGVVGLGSGSIMH